MRGDPEVVVVGAGFGGLGAALALAEAGLAVRVHERLGYPGGCAGRFHREGQPFDAGATLVSGLAPHQLFGRWMARYGLPVSLDWDDPLVELRTPTWRLPIARGCDRALALSALPGAPPAALLRAFFERQRRAADELWSILDAPERLPPLDSRAVAHHLARWPQLLALGREMGRPLGAWLRARRLDGPGPFAVYLDALCQIALQCRARDAELSFALGALDYYDRGTAHVSGGPGALAEALVEAIRAAGGEVRYHDPVRALAAERGGWRVHARRGSSWVPAVVANLPPAALSRLIAPGTPPPRDLLGSLARRGRREWGAAMWYLALEEPVPRPARHLQLVVDPARPLHSGNHLFCSLGELGPLGRSLVVSTHVPLGALRGASGAERAAVIAAIQERMSDGLARLAPEWAERVSRKMSASPRTFARFTARPAGWVGGIPRTAGLDHYRRLIASTEVLPRLYLAGDTVGLGQSALSAATTGTRVAEAIRRALAR